MTACRHGKQRYQQCPECDTLLCQWDELYAGHQPCLTMAVWPVADVNTTKEILLLCAGHRKLVAAEVVAR